MRNAAIFATVCLALNLVAQQGDTYIPEPRIAKTHCVPGSLHTQAVSDRAQAEARLLDPATHISDSGSPHLFYTREEGEDIY